MGGCAGADKTRQSLAVATIGSVLASLCLICELTASSFNCFPGFHGFHGFPPTMMPRPSAQRPVPSATAPRQRSWPRTLHAPPRIASNQLLVHRSATHSHLLKYRTRLDLIQVLVTTGLRRTDSITTPDLFHYHEHFTFLSTIGETKSSQVFKVAHRQSGEVFAVKRSRKRFRSKLQRERCLREIQMVASLPEMENIVAQYRAWQEGGHFYIQMDYCDGGSLQQELEGNLGGRLERRGLWGVVRDVSAGLQFLHGNNVLHLDIKPENLYRKKSRSVVDGSVTHSGWKIGDFGLAIGKEATDWEEGDGDYVAPELLRAATEQPYPAADIFSLGATVFQCATGRKLPRCVGSPNADISSVLGDGNVDDDVRVLLKAMTLPDPRMRPSASQVLAYAEAVLRGDVARPELTAVVGTREGVMSGQGVTGKVLTFERNGEVEDGGTGDADDADNAVDEGLHDIDTSRSSDLNQPSSSSGHQPQPNPPKLPLLNLKQKSFGNSMNMNSNGQLSASNSFRIMRRDTGRDSEYADSEFGSLCDTERTMTTIADMQCQDDVYLNDDLHGDVNDDLVDIVSPRRDGAGLFGPLSSRLLRGHGSLTYEMASPDVNISSGDPGAEPDNAEPDSARQGAGGRPSKGHKSQSRTGNLQQRSASFGTGVGEEIQQKTSSKNRIGLAVWNEFDGTANAVCGVGAGCEASRFRSPFADGGPGCDEASMSARDVVMDKENKHGSEGPCVTASKPILSMSKASKVTKAGNTRNRPPHIPLLPIQSNKLANKQNFGKKRQHSYRNSARSARSSHRSNSNDLSARSIDALMPPNKRVEVGPTPLGFEGLESELSARMKLI